MIYINKSPYLYVSTLNPDKNKYIINLKKIHLYKKNGVHKNIVLLTRDTICIPNSFFRCSRSTGLLSNYLPLVPKIKKESLKKLH